MTVKLRCVREYHGPQWPYARVGEVRELEPYQVDQLMHDLPSAFERIVEVPHADPADSGDQADGDGQDRDAGAQGEAAEAAPQKPKALETPKGRGRPKAAQED